MGTFTCQQLANGWNWGACPCEHSPMPNLGSVSSPSWPSVINADAWMPYERQGAKNQCCDIACGIAQNANPVSPFEPVGQMGGLNPSGRKPSDLYSNDNRKKGFRGQSGGGTMELVETSLFYQQGVNAAQAAFQAGGVNALLSFLAGFNAGQ